MVDMDVLKILKELFPINRSITGDGLRESFAIMKKYVPLSIIEYKSKMLCFDWEIPLEWNVNKAYIHDSKGNKIVDFADNNLHLMGYSVKFDGYMNLTQLKKHLYTIKEQPNAIPFVTSYYEKKWGFCIEYNKYLKLEEDQYYVLIDSTHKEGSLTLAQGHIRGQSEKEILLHSYVGHPSMANDQLSGPLSLLLVYEYLLKHRDDLRYSYRILLTPETIGTISYIYNNIDSLKKNVIAGYVLCFTGDQSEIKYKQCKKIDSLSNKAITNIMNIENNENIYPYSPIGCDERHFNCHGIDLPIGCIMRSGPENYDEYHTSLDNIEFVDVEKISEVSKIVIEAIKNIEINDVITPKHTMCEPKLDKLGLYPKTAGKLANKEKAFEVLNVWGFCDGQKDIIDISNLINKKAYTLKNTIEISLNNNLISIGDNNA